MATIQAFLNQILFFFINNWIYAAALAVVIIILAIKKPAAVFKAIVFIAVILGLCYILVYLEQSMFSGVSSTKKGYNSSQNIE